MFVQDRHMRVPQGKVVETGYVEVHMVKLACKDRIAVGDVDRAYQKALQLGSDQSFPPPNGYWDDDYFVIQDGRHEFISRLMLGQTHIFVAWIK